MAGRSLFPPAPIEEARVLADTIARSGSGQPMRRIDVFDVLGRSPDSGPSRNLVTASSSFGLTGGGYQAEFLALTDLGRRLAVDGDETATIDAVLGVDVFRKFFETYANSQLPSDVAARSFLAKEGIPADRTQACLDLVLQNGRYVGLIAQRSGTDYVLTREHAVESRQPSGQGLGEAVQSLVIRGKSPPAVAPRLQGAIPMVQITLAVHLPSDVSAEAYDSIFRSIRRHLIGIPDEQTD